MNERVTKAREAVYGLIHAGFANELANRDLDELISAVRAAPLAEIRGWVASDSLAVSFQTLGQYRSALLNFIAQLEAK